MGASWNRSLWTAIGTAVSDEVRGLYSQGGTMKGGWESALFLWAPNINPFRDRAHTSTADPQPASLCKSTLFDFHCSAACASQRAQLTSTVHSARHAF